MQPSFTGSARKPRQINLSGRNTTNPWTNLASSTKPSLSGSGTHNAVAQAQADRIRRQQERDRINAAKKIQRVWRGHSSRAIQKQKWREEWDTIEMKRLQLDTDSIHIPDGLLKYSDTPYSTLQTCMQQMRRLIRFLNSKHESDTTRLLFSGYVLRNTLQQSQPVHLDEKWTSTLRELAIIASYQIETLTASATQLQMGQELIIQLLGLNTFLTGSIPDEVASDSDQHFHAMQRLLILSTRNNEMLAAISGFIITMLSHITKSNVRVLLSLVREIVTKPQLQHASPLLEFLRQPSQLDLLSQAALQYAQHASSSKIVNNAQIDNQLWLLSYLIYLRRESSRMYADDVEIFANWLDVTSILLNQSANHIAIRIDQVDQPMGESNAIEPTPLAPFVREQVSSLSQQSSVGHVMDQLRKDGGMNGSKSTAAKALANYAIALLRAFPERAGNIRMWLYRGSPTVYGDESISTIRYLWQASEKTSVFQKVRDQKQVLSVLTEAAPEHNQIGRAQVSATEITLWQEEWRIVLLFLELYTFILKLMDDEEFFALDKRKALRIGDKTQSSFQKGALPLDDVASLTIFLKNLAFPLYWHAADLDESNEAEEVSELSAFFGTAPVEPVRTVEKKPAQTLAGNGVSQTYLKGLVTGLLRMLHERDSRRKFLPDGHWLMTSHFDMNGFISAVVAEEERRHESSNEYEDGDEDNDRTQPSIDGDMMDTDALLPSLNTMFGIRPPHTPRSHASRFAEQMRKREVAKRKRQSESLAPRLEILRNLPFFIPFETRVQIFREFVYRDQLRRRNGWIDADEWRMSIATGTQGRGLGGHGRLGGMDLINRHRGEIRRGSVFQDAYDQFYELGEGLKEPIQISFIDRFGAPEAGIDGGGVTKEFLISVTSEAFDPNSDLQMFVENEQRYLYPNPNKFETVAESLRCRGLTEHSDVFKTKIRDLLRQYEFLGRVVGKCLYEGILVDIVFAGFFLLKWALTGGTTSATNETAYRASINDLRDYDDSLYQGLLKLKNYSGDVESDFALDFTVSDEVRLPGRNYTITKDLIPNGSSTPVNNANRLVYIDKITRYRLQQQPAAVTNAFLKGLGQVIQPMWLAMFNQRELQKLVGGDSAELDIADLRRNTQYGGLYVIGDDGLEHPTVALFWKVLKDMSDEDRRKVLKFVTSTPRSPLLGFGHLNPKFSIRDSSEDQTRLPSTSTCVNLLKLPRYGDEKTMREKLLYAVNSGAGFDLS